MSNSPTIFDDLPTKHLPRLGFIRGEEKPRVVGGQALLDWHQLINEDDVLREVYRDMPSHMKFSVDDKLYESESELDSEIQLASKIQRYPAMLCPPIALGAISTMQSRDEFFFTRKGARLEKQLILDKIQKASKYGCVYDDIRSRVELIAKPRPHRKPTKESVRKLHSFISLPSEHETYWFETTLTGGTPRGFLADKRTDQSGTIWILFEEARNLEGFALDDAE